MDLFEDARGPADPTPYPGEGETEAFQKFLEEIGGFTGVSLEHLSIPEHVITFLTDDDTAADDIEDLRACCCYWRVSTDQGSFGILRSLYVLLDLHGTGLKGTDLFDEGEIMDVEHDPECNDPDCVAGEIELAGFDPTDEAFMRRLKDKLAEKSTKE